MQTGLPYWVHVPEQQRARREQPRYLRVRLCPRHVPLAPLHPHWDAVLRALRPPLPAPPPTGQRVHARRQAHRSLPPAELVARGPHDAPVVEPLEGVPRPVQPRLVLEDAHVAQRHRRRPVDPHLHHSMQRLKGGQVPHTRRHVPQDARETDRRQPVVLGKALVLPRHREDDPLLLSHRRYLYRQRLRVRRRSSTDRHRRALGPAASTAQRVYQLSADHVDSHVSLARRPQEAHRQRAQRLLQVVQHYSIFRFR
mmetsp:Transcript_20072/g.66771  ORF Transcript_20072/g.66771 Transcript_20072/m.66771 type:complete len:254 (-) Transcript_20072:309-1070(-)